MFISHTVSFVKAVMSQVVKEGDAVVDATVGNGIDTLFLSRQVGAGGQVHGFDIQQSALESARQRLAEQHAPDNVTLHLAGHERMAEVLPEEVLGRVGAVMFNFGYLPGGDETLITRPETSCAAIDAALTVMRRGGVASMVLYTGHPGGAEEAEAIDTHCAAIPMDRARVMQCRMTNHPGAQTRVLLVEKR